MNPDLTTIKAAIEASRECEQAALPGELIGKRATRPDNTGGYDYAIAANIDGEYRVVAEFFQNVGRGVSVDPAAIGAEYIYARDMEPKFREALAIADAALVNVLDVAKRGSEPYQLISGPALGEYVNKARVAMCKLFEEAPHD